MDKEILKDRFKKFALRVIRLAQALPKITLGRIVESQLIRCGTSSASNYRAACRAKSKKDFIAKLGIVEEELDECMFWFEIIIESGLQHKSLLDDIYNEANELLSITIKSKITARK